MKKNYLFQKVIIPNILFLITLGTWCNVSFASLCPDPQIATQLCVNNQGNEIKGSSGGFEYDIICPSPPTAFDFEKAGVILNSNDDEGNFTVRCIINAPPCTEFNTCEGIAKFKILQGNAAPENPNQWTPPNKGMYSCGPAFNSTPLNSCTFNVNP